jgi:hypothetical protein
VFNVATRCNQHLGAKVRCDFAELFESGFETFDDFLGENVGIHKVVGFF